MASLWYTEAINTVFESFITKEIFLSKIVQKFHVDVCFMTKYMLVYVCVCEWILFCVYLPILLCINIYMYMM